MQRRPPADDRMQARAPADDPMHGRPDEDPPPFGGSWGVLYLIVLLNLALLILLFYAFTKAFS